MTLTKKELTRAAKELRTRIGELCKELDAEMKPMRGVCTDLSNARERYESALAAYERKASDKNAQRLTRAKESLGTAWTLYSDAYDGINALYGAVLNEYDRLIEIAEGLGDKELAKAKKEREAFVANHGARLSKARGDALVDLPSFLAISAEPAPAPAPTPADAPAEAAPAPVAAPAPAPAATASVASVGIAPVTIDISAYVERAISATMDRLTVAMERKIDEYVAGLEIPAPVIPAPVAAPAVEPAPADAPTAAPAVEPAPADAPTAAPAVEPAPVTLPAGIDTALVEELTAAVKANDEMLRHLIDEQNHVYEKLRGMISSVERLVGNISDLGTTYAELIAAHSAAQETMRTVMRAQRDALAAEEAILREQAEITAAAISAATPTPADTDADGGASAAPSPDPAPAEIPASEPDEPDEPVDAPVVRTKVAPAPDVTSLSADDEFRG